jgi:hypothetical protein
MEEGSGQPFIVPVIAAKQDQTPLVLELLFKVNKSKTKENVLLVKKGDRVSCAPADWEARNEYVWVTATATGESGFVPSSSVKKVMV